LVYAAKSSDVTDVMVNGTWLLREREYQTIEIGPLLKGAAGYAKRISAFLVEREDSVVSKLVAIGGAEQEESYEVQIKTRLLEPGPVVELLESGKLNVLRTVRYKEYDTYYTFDDLDQGRLRYREDEFINEADEVYNVRYRLTLIGPVAEREFAQSVLLSRSRFIAPATHSERFYREYFDPSEELAIHKDRRRWLVNFRDEEFFINIDQLLEPQIEGHFLEIKARTWSRRDAEVKAGLILDLLEALGLKGAEEVKQEYPELVLEASP
jgi:5-methylthioadenosine/S-adenosylhomocysteine deaminase